MKSYIKKKQLLQLGTVCVGVLRECALEKKKDSMTENIMANHSEAGRMRRLGVVGGVWRHACAVGEILINTTLLRQLRLGGSVTATATG